MCKIHILPAILCFHCADIKIKLATAQKNWWGRHFYSSRKSLKEPHPVTLSKVNFLKPHTQTFSSQRRKCLDWFADSDQSFLVG